MISLIKRNMLLFFKDKTSVFFSFMAVFVVLGLYVCFLGDMMIQPLKQDFPDTARELSDTWIMAGTLGIVSLTTSLSVLGIIIEDKSRSILAHFAKKGHRRLSPLYHMYNISGIRCNIDNRRALYRCLWRLLTDTVRTVKGACMHDAVYPVLYVNAFFLHVIF